MLSCLGQALWRDKGFYQTYLDNKKALMCNPLQLDVIIPESFNFGA